MQRPQLEQSRQAPQPQASDQVLTGVVTGGARPQAQAKDAAGDDIDPSTWGFHEHAAVLTLADAYDAGDEALVEKLVETLRRQAKYSRNPEFVRWVSHLDEFFPRSQ